MHLVIIRHAQAEHAGPAHSDFDRALTRRGVKDAGRSANAIASFDLPRPVSVVTSPKVRALETARIVAARLDAGEPRTLAILKGDHDPDSILRELAAQDGVASLIVVGHMPDLGYVLARLLRPGANGGVALATGGYVWVEVDAIPPTEPALVRRLGGAGN